MTDSINQLITMCTQQAPGQKECDNALRELEVGPVRINGVEVEERVLGWRVRGVSWISLHPPPLQTVRELLENPVQPINDMSYFGCLDSVMENSKVSAPRNPGGQRTGRWN